MTKYFQFHIIEKNITFDLEFTMHIAINVRHIVHDEIMRQVSENHHAEISLCLKKFRTYIIQVKQNIPVFFL